jgi:hypothetical protein
MPAPEYCTLEQAWGNDYNPKYASPEPIQSTRKLNDGPRQGQGTNQLALQNRNQQTNQLYHPSHLKTRTSNRPTQNQNQPNQNNLLFESATGNYFKDIKEYEPYQEVDYKNGCNARPNNPLFPDENHQKLIEPNDRKYFSRTMAPLKDTQGPSNRYFSNPLIQNLKHEQETEEKKSFWGKKKENKSKQPTGLYENGTGGYFPISDLGNESNYFTQAMKSLVNHENENNKNNNTCQVLNGYDRNGAFMTLNQRETNDAVAQSQNMIQSSRLTNGQSNVENFANMSMLNTEKFANMETYINYLEKNNDLLRQQITLIQNQQNNDNTDTRSTKMYVFDLLLYIISGIFIIYILDLFVKMLLKGKK